MIAFTSKVLGLVALLALAACAPATRIESNRSASYTTQPTRVYVHTEIHPEWGNAFTAAFERRLGTILKECGAASQFGRIDKLELNEKARLDEMRKFGPDAVLTARHNGGTKDQYGKLILGIYDSRLADVKTGEIVWRASSTVSRGGITIELAERGDAFAVELSNKLKQDQIFRTCPIIELKK